MVFRIRIVNGNPAILDPERDLAAGVDPENLPYHLWDRGLPFGSDRAHFLNGRWHGSGPSRRMQK
jgi:hypothetical protein